MSNLDKILSDAIEYARGIVIKGSTQLETNVLLNDQRSALWEGIKSIRETYEPLSRGYDELAKCLNLVCESENQKQEILNFLAYENEVALVQKFSIGNCFELALMTFDYLSHLDEPEIKEVELLLMSPGDHAFCVINRNNRFYNTPFRWGDQSKIVDSWGGEAFPAIQYLQKLKSFKRINGINQAIAYDPIVNKIGKPNVKDFEYSKTFLRNIEEKFKDLLKNTSANIETCIIKYSQILEKFKREFTYLYSRIKNARECQKNEVKEKLDCIESALTKLNGYFNQLTIAIDEIDIVQVRDSIKDIIYVLQKSRLIFNETNKFITHFNIQSSLLSTNSNFFDGSYAKKENQFNRDINKTIQIVFNDLKQNFK